MRPSALLSCAVLVFVSAAQAAAATILYSAIDIPDKNPGEDLWGYRYQLQGFEFSAGQGFSIWFGRTETSQLLNTTPPRPDWDIRVIQPDWNLPDNGAFDALALRGNASAAQPFTVQFLWMGEWGS
jgi:hypothetical protein